MKKIQSNQHYFEISQESPEPHLDKSYFFLEKHPELPLYIANVKEIKEIIITIKKLKESNEDEETIERYYKKLFEIFNNNYANCSELGCFVNAFDTTRDLIQKDYESFKEITNLFIQKRDLDDNVPENWVQAIIDSKASKRKGGSGENKLVSILNDYGFAEADDWDELDRNKRCVARFSKKWFSTVDIRKKLGIKMHAKKQDKNLDLLIKNNNKIFLLEAKHLNVGGGGQDKQISELIEIVSLKELKKNIYYVAFLDGTYSNVLLGKISKRARKKLKQVKEIKKYLNENPHNFWLNTAGFKTLISDL